MKKLALDALVSLVLFGTMVAPGAIQAQQTGGNFQDWLTNIFPYTQPQLPPPGPGSRIVDDQGRTWGER